MLTEPPSGPQPQRSIRYLRLDSFSRCSDDNGWGTLHVPKWSRGLYSIYIHLRNLRPPSLTELGGNQLENRATEYGIFDILLFLLTLWQHLLIYVTYLSMLRSTGKTRAHAYFLKAWRMMHGNTNTNPFTKIVGGKRNLRMVCLLGWLWMASPSVYMAQ